VKDSGHVNRSDPGKLDKERKVFERKKGDDHKKILGGT